MPQSIRQIEWKRSSATDYIDITDAIEQGSVSATPHPNEDIDRPKGYSVTLTLTPNSTALADDLQAALLDVEPAEINILLEGDEEPIRGLPVSVSKVPHLDTQNTAELGVPPEGHDRLHEHL